MNKLIVLIAIVFGLVLAACQTTKAQKLTKTEGEYRLWFAVNCIRPWSQFSTEFAEIAQGTRYASKFKHFSQEWAKICAESPQSVQEKEQWLKRESTLAKRGDNTSFNPFLESASPEKRAEVWRIVSCRKGVKTMMQEIAQLGIDQDPSRAKRIKRLYAKAVRDQKTLCENTFSIRRFLAKSNALYANRITPLIRAVESRL